MKSKRWLRKPSAGVGGRLKMRGRKGTKTPPVSLGGEQSSRRPSEPAASQVVLQVHDRCYGRAMPRSPHVRSVRDAPLLHLVHKPETIYKQQNVVR